MTASSFAQATNIKSKAIPIINPNSNAGGVSIALLNEGPKIVVLPAGPRATLPANNPSSIDTKALTCHFWANTGSCKWPESECLYAHQHTGKIASEPAQVEEGRPAVAGRNAASGNPGYFDWRGFHGRLGVVGNKEISPALQYQIDYIRAKNHSKSTATHQLQVLRDNVNPAALHVTNPTALQQLQSSVKNMPYFMSNVGQQKMGDYRAPDNMAAVPSANSQATPSGEPYVVASGGAGASFQTLQAAELSAGASLHGPYNPVATSFQQNEATRRASAVSSLSMLACPIAHCPNPNHHKALRCPNPMEHFMALCPKPVDHAGRTSIDFDHYEMVMTKDRCIWHLADALDFALRHASDIQQVNFLNGIKDNVTTAMENVGAEKVLPPTWYLRYDAE